jgi:tetratricopeptide (TPR) repeat protein
MTTDPRTLSATSEVVPGADLQAFNFNWSALPDGTNATPREPLAPPMPDQTQVGRYLIQGVLGRGGMGVVYRAWDDNLRRWVALKWLHANPYAPTALARFQSEAQLLAQISSPHLVQVYEIGQHAGHAYIALELVAGPSLRTRLQVEPLTDRVAAEWLLALAQAVQAAHRHGIIHRDLKPANVLLHPEAAAPGGFVPKLTDFGLAKRVDQPSDLTQSGCVVGTPAYMAPEQAQGRPDVGPLADVYGLGAILYECLTGRPPFVSPLAVDLLARVVQLPPVPPRQLQPSISPDLETICLKCLEKAPAQRYGSATALADDLRRFLAHQPISARPLTRREHLWRWCRRHPREAGWIGAFGVLLLLALATSWGLTSWALHNADQARRERQSAQAEQLRAQTLQTQAQADLRTIQSLQADLRRQVNTFFVSIAQDEQLQLAALEPLRQTLLTRAKEFYQTLLPKYSALPEFRAEYLQARLALASVTAELGALPSAIQEYDAICAQAQDPHSRVWLAQALYERGQVRLRHGATPAGVADLHAAVTAYRTLIETDPAGDEHTIRLGQVLTRLGLHYAENHQFDASQPLLDEALQLRSGLAERHPQHPERLLERADAYLSRSKLAFRAGQLAAAEVDAVQARQRFEQMPSGDPEAQFSLGLTLQQLGDIYETGRQYAQATTVLSAAQTVRQRLLQAQPQRMLHRLYLANTQFHLARVALKQERISDGGAHLEAAQATLRMFGETNTHTPASLTVWADVSVRLGLHYGYLRQFDSAERAYGQAIDAFARLVPHPVGSRDFALNLAQALTYRAGLLTEQHRVPAALADYARALDLLRPRRLLPRPATQYRATLTQRAELLTAQEQWQAAATDWEELAGLVPNASELRGRQLRCLVAGDQPQAAVQVLRQLAARGHAVAAVPAELQSYPAYQTWLAEVHATERLPAPQPER